MVIKIILLKSVVPIDVLPLSCDKYALNIRASSVFSENSFPGSFGLNMYTPVWLKLLLSPSTVVFILYTIIPEPPIPLSNEFSSV